MSAREQLLKLVEARIQSFDELALRQLLNIVEAIESTPVQPDEDPILALAGMLEGEPIAADEIDEILYGPLEVK